MHRVYVDGFWMDQTELTNGEFEKFVRATGYVTIAERKPTKEEFPTAPPENLVAGSTVFTPELKKQFHSTTITSGGDINQTQTGVILMDRRATSKGKKSIQSYSLHTTTLLLMENGQANDYPLKLNGNLRRAVG